MPTEIKKVVVTKFGGPEVLEIVNATLPDPPPNHVQVKILYSGFAGADLNMRLGRYPLQKKAPLTPGYCFAGTVSINGANCSRFKVGDRVVCLSIYDAEATYTNQPEKFLIPIPEGLDAKIATALVLDWNTAYEMVQGRDWNGKRVFIHGMSGAVGYALTTLCKLQGAEVYGTASARNHEALKKLGVTPFVYTDKNWITAMKALGGVHGVFDALGFEIWDESYSILSEEKSILFAYGMNQDTLNDGETRGILWPMLKLLSQNLKFWSNKSTTFYYISRTRSSFRPNLEKLFSMVLDGKVTIPIKQEFALDDIRSVHENWTRLTGMGSVVIKVA
ncbi:hypothetical protein B0A52_05497 [Exophiala mesophila]|uniref:Enoyl reductase (ER) domain-containing protein n=1 Tax=Exophiala mesophila TaxID=212818 RepID=A0A438N397_EXOME|nr:hypothetical protein B0A52_05497 [Exophiala mesophila]